MTPPNVTSPLPEAAEGDGNAAIVLLKKLQELADESPPDVLPRLKLLLEEDAPTLAKRIGKEVFLATVTPEYLRKLILVIFNLANRIREQGTDRFDVKETLQKALDINQIIKVYNTYELFFMVQLGSVNFIDKHIMILKSLNNTLVCMLNQYPLRHLRKAVHPDDSGTLNEIVQRYNSNRTLRILTKKVSHKELLVIKNTGSVPQKYSKLWDKLNRIKTEGDLQKLTEKNGTLCNVCFERDLEVCGDFAILDGCSDVMCCSCAAHSFVEKNRLCTICSEPVTGWTTKSEVKLYLDELAQETATLEELAAKRQRDLLAPY